MGLIKGILIYKYARRRANKKRDRQDAREEACEQEEQEEKMLSGSWGDEICDYCGRTNEEHLDDTEPCS